MSNVLVDLHRLGGNKYNGLYHFCLQLGKHLAGISPEDMSLFFYVPEKQKKIFGDRAHYAIQRSRDKFFRPGTAKFNLWHVATTLSWYRPFNSKTKIVYTIHDLNFLNEPEYSTASKKRFLRLIQQRANRADHLTYISQFARKQAGENLDTGHKPYSIIYNGCNIPVTKLFKEPLHKPAKQFLFSIGQFHSRKNFHVLPALLAGNDYELVIAGLNDFPYTQKVLDEARRFGVESRIKLTGAITDEEKYWYYQNCLAFVFPGIGEGFCLPVPEAMQFGKPVFLSKHTSLPEAGGDAAFYFDDFDAEHMQHVFKKGMLEYSQKDLSGVIKQQAAKFSWQKAAREYLDVYRSLL